MNINEYEQYVGEEEEFSIKDILFHILYRWRSCIVVALAGAILLGGYQYWKIWSVHKEGELTEEEQSYIYELENYRNSLKNAQANIQNYTELLNERNEYLEKSIYLNLDYGHEWIGTRTYYVRLSDMETSQQNTSLDPTDALLNAYVNGMGGHLSDEVVTSVLGTDDITLIKEVIQTNADYSANIFKVSVISNGKETVELILQHLDDVVQQTLFPMVSELEPHLVSISFDSISQQKDKEVLNARDKVTASITDYEKKIADNQKIVDKLIRDEEPKAPGKHIVRYAAIGFVLFGCIMAGFYLVMYILQGYIHNSDEVKSVIPLPVYAQKTIVRAKRDRNWIDRLLIQLEFGKKKQSDQAFIERIAALICENYTDKNVVFTGDCSEDELKQLQGAVADAIGKTVTISTCKNLLDYPEGLSTCTEADVVLLVGKRYVSKMQTLIEEYSMLQIGKAPISGIILI